MILVFLIVPPTLLLSALYGAITGEGEYHAREKWKFLLKRESPMKSTQREKKISRCEVSQKRLRG